tara:strand:- start:1416 stop:3212 length:1797 start_codon:yes stop_codon:yes gene_type:complete
MQNIQRVSDRIAEILSENGIKKVFMVTGGGSMHLNDALSKNKALDVINMHHEQSCSMAAEGYARVNNEVACVNVTTGPGGINAINGVFGAWTDSVPMIVVSGQVKRETLNPNSSKLRQLGDQENDIVSMVKKITKFSYLLKDPNQVDSVFSTAIKVANSGRKGPVWIDVPIDVQGAEYNKSNQIKIKQVQEIKLKNPSNKEVNEILKLLNNADRPAIIAGGGVRLSGAYKEFINFVESTNIPVLTAWNSHDLLHNKHKNYAGRPGTVGDRAGNFIAENCDLLLILGSRLNIRQIGYNYKSFSSNSYKIMVDIDKEELNKNTLNIDLKLNYDLKIFLKTMNKFSNKISNKNHKSYLSWCKSLNKKFPVFQEKFRKSNKINPYLFVNQLFRFTDKKSVVVTSDGTAVVSTFQGAIIKKGQRLFSNSGSASMGFGLPASIGACFANQNNQIICIEGDGSLQMNIQELATVKMHELPIKIFVLSNEGYHSIRQTQSKYFPENIVGCGPDSGLFFPKLSHIAKGYGIDYIKVNKSLKLNETLDKVFNFNGPIICEVVLDKNQEFEPKASSKLYHDGSMKSAPLYDLYPFLDEQVVQEIINYKN